MRQKQLIVFVFSDIISSTLLVAYWCSPLKDLYGFMAFSYHDFCTLFKRYLVRLLCLLLHLQVKISYLEMSLYEKLKGIKITNERLILIRYQARKLLTCPMLRGEDVLPLLLATFIFEVLCQKHVTSTVLQAKPITFIDGLNIMPDDEILGYECGIKALGKNVASNIRSVLV